MPDPKDEVYVYDPEDWEITYPWDDRNDLVDALEPDMDIREPKRLETLVHGPNKWIAIIVLSWDDTGDPDETEVRWFDTEEEAKKAIAKSLEGKPE
jgi:hypothetical protein